MTLRLKYIVVAVLLAVSQMLALYTVSAHAGEPEHVGQECDLCLTVQANDTGSLKAEISLAVPPALYWTMQDKPALEAIIKALSGTVKARAPPL